MGQQQLLLVILVTIIVGIATVVAINIFGAAADQANDDAIRQDLLAAAAQAQGLYNRPTMMGGAGRDFGSIEDEVIAQRLGIPGALEGNVATNENGIYTISSTSADALQILVTPANGKEQWTATISFAVGAGWTTTIVDGDGNTQSTNTEEAEE